MLMLILAIAAAVVVFYYLIIKPHYYWRDKGVKQGNPLGIIADNWRSVLKKLSLAELTLDVYNQWPNVRYSGMYQFFVPTLIVRDPDLIKQITVKDFDHFMDHGIFVPEDGDPLWVRNLFSLKGQKWRDMRAILSPSFTSSKMKAMFVLISECADNFTQYFLKKNEDVIEMEFKDIFTRFTNDVIATTAFGIKVDSLDKPNNYFYLMGKEATDFTGFWKNVKFFGYFLMPKIYSFLKIQMFSKEVSHFFRQIVTDTIKVREEKGIVRPDMINLLLEARKGVQKHEENSVIDTGFSTAQESELQKPTKLAKDISDLDIAAQAMIFFFAGFDSVSGLMCFLSHELATNPDVQDKLREEVRTTFQEYEGKLTYEGLLKMKYLDMVVSEALRKWPIAAAADRVCTKNYTIEPVTPEEKPVHLQKGDVLLLPTFGLHRDPQHFPNPERFDPDRFSDENKGNIKPYTYFPFGLGPRNCIGSRFALLEAKTVIFYILRHFEIIPVEKTRIHLKISRKHINLSSEGGFWLGLKRIKA